MRNIGKFVISIIPFLIMICLHGCAHPNRVVNTYSGLPDVTIETNDIDIVKSNVITNMIQKGFILNDESNSRINFSKTMEGGQAIAAQMLIGNSYSTTPQAEINFVITSVNNNTRIIANMSMSTQMALGQIKRMPMNNNNNWFNDIQSLLLRIKSDIERENKPPEQIKNERNSAQFKDTEAKEEGEEFYVFGNRKPVRFPHKRHQTAGIACEVCHVNDLSKMMSTDKKSGHEHCVSCHRLSNIGDKCSSCHQ